jgi:hypothetical protein
MGEVPRDAGLQEGGCCRMDPLLRAAVGYFDSGDGVHIVQKIVLEIARDGNAKPLRKVGSMGRGSCRMDPLLWEGGRTLTA